MVGTVLACLFWTAFAAGLVHEWRLSMPMNERCRDCGQPAAFRCEAREVAPRKVERVNGIDKVTHTYLEFFLCAPCCTKAVASETPPRSAKALPHHRRILRAAETGA